MSNKKNESQRKDRITWGQTLRLHLRAVKDIRRICPHIFTIYALSALAKAVTPYVIIWFSARIINELASARRTDVLWAPGSLDCSCFCPFGARYLLSVGTPKGHPLQLLAACA